MSVRKLIIIDRRGNHYARSIVAYATSALRGAISTFYHGSFGFSDDGL